MEERIKVVRLDVRTLDSQKKAVRHSIGQLQQRLAQLSEEASTGAAAQGALLRLHALETLGLLTSRFRQIDCMTLGSIRSHNPPPGSAAAICEVVRDTITVQNERVKELKQQLRESIASYNDMVVFMRARLQALGVSHSAIPARSPLQGESVPAADDELAAALEVDIGEAQSQPAPATNSMSLPAAADHKKEIEETSGNEMIAARRAAAATSATIVEGSTQHPGWTVTWPCAKASSALHLNAQPLQRFLKTIVKQAAFSASTLSKVLCAFSFEQADILSRNLERVH
ncbi:hypothetical protein Emed_003292 [Eimeria media]